jgi:hypothetical protein
MKVMNETGFAVEALPLMGPGDRAALAVIVKGTFTIVPGAAATVAGEQLPILFGDVPHDEKAGGGSLKFESDIVAFKPRADVVLIGQAHAPSGKPPRFVDTSLRVGRLRKVVRVFGDRRWRWGGRFLPVRATEPKPFRTMDLVYERAFGGIDKVGGGCSRYNPVGRGFLTKRAKKIVQDAPLPNLEDPRHPIRSWKSQPRPVGYAWWGRGWLPRVDHLGTYDEKWQKSRAPLPPEDFSWEFHNGAPADQQVEGYLRGDEPVEMVNLAPESKLEFRLSGIAPVCRVARGKAGSGPAAAATPPPAAAAVPDEPELPVVPDEEDSPAVDDEPAPGGPDGEDVQLNLDTVCFMPDEMRFYQVWRGLFPVEDLTAQEVAAVAVWRA